MSRRGKRAEVSVLRCLRCEGSVRRIRTPLSPPKVKVRLYSCLDKTCGAIQQSEERMTQLLNPVKGWKAGPRFKTVRPVSSKTHS